MTRPAWSAWLVLLGLCLLGATAWSDPAMQSYSDPEESYSISYPSQLFLMDDPQSLGRIKESVSHQMPKNQFDITRQGIQFVILYLLQVDNMPRGTRSWSNL